MSTLEFLGIYPYDIELASDKVDRVCKRHGIHDDVVWASVCTYFESLFASDHQPYGSSTFTDALINLIFNCLRDSLLDAGFTDDRINWDVNGRASYFIVDGEYF